MSVTVELTYDMSKELGLQRFEIEGAATVEDALRLARERFGAAGDRFDVLSRVAAIAVNRVLMSHKQGRRTRLSDGDTLTFVKAAAGG
jgi:molybdopterin converting factor small subunit